MSELCVQACSAGAVFDDPASAALIDEYERECANPMLGACAPRRDIYELLEAQGAAQCFAAYAGGTLAGFAFVLTTDLPHYGRGRRFATVESLFVAPASRGCGLGRRLMDTVESYAREAGCATISYCAPVGSRLARLLFLSADRYTNTHHVFCRSPK